MFLSCASPHAPRTLLLRNADEQSVGFAVKTGLLLAKPLELLAKRTHLPFAPFFDLRDLLLQGVKILLHGRERRQYLALFLQFPLVFSLLAFRFGRGRSRSRSTRSCSARWACASCDLR